MPHDYNGSALQVGDEVYLRGTVTKLNEGAEYCNCSVKPLYPMPPYGIEDVFELSAINTKQLVKV